MEDKSMEDKGKKANCSEKVEELFDASNAVEQSSDAAHAMEDKRKEKLYSAGGGRKMDFCAEETPPDAEQATDEDGNK